LRLLSIEVLLFVWKSIGFYSTPKDLRWQLEEFYIIALHDKKTDTKPKIALG
jgi:hypothetical protein